MSTGTALAFNILSAELIAVGIGHQNALLIFVCRNPGLDPVRVPGAEPPRPEDPFVLGLVRSAGRDRLRRYGGAFFVAVSMPEEGLGVAVRSSATLSRQSLRDHPQGIAATGS